MPMMHACVDTTRPYGVKTMVSLNTIMVDGTGMCGSCRVTVGGEIRLACVDGPDFDGHLVDFEDLTARLVRYKRAENEALQTWKDGCRIRTAAESAAVPPPMAVDQPSTDA